MFLGQLVPTFIFILIASFQAALAFNATTSNDTTHVMQRFDETSLSTPPEMQLSTAPSSTSPPETTLRTTKATTTAAATTPALTTSTMPPSSPTNSSMPNTTTFNNDTTVSTTLAHEESICLNAYSSCFSKWMEKYFNDSSIALFCDYSFYSGNACMYQNIKDSIIFQPPNPKKPFYSFLECSRLNPNSEPLKQLSWNFLSYCIYNSPTNSSNPDCFKKIQVNCTNPTSSKCSSICIEYIPSDQSDYSDPDIPADSSPSRTVFSIVTLLISTFILF